MRIIYRPHLSKRLKERKIPVSYPNKILKSPDEEYFDFITNHHISIKKLHYAEKLRHIVVAYDIIDEIREVITIYPISESELRNKITSRRWKAYEKN